MAIPNLKTKIKQNLKKDIEAEKSKGNDTRLLNYYDLKDEEKMTILFVPDQNGEFWAKKSLHGPNLHIIKDKKKVSVRGAGSINCAYKSSGDDCPACQKGFELFNESNDTGDKDLREEGKKWMSRDYTLVSCIVLESPFEVASDEKNNQVKLMYLPYAVENLIKEAITEGLIDEDELCQTPFIIKKTKKGPYASYENSYFARKPIQDGDLGFLEDLVVEQYDYGNLDLIPAPTSTKEVAEWLEKAEAAYQKALDGASDNSEEEEDDRPVRKQKSALDNLTKRKKKEPEPEQEEEEEDNDPPFETDEPEHQEEEEEEEEERPSTSSQMDRLRALSRGRRQ